MNRYDFQNRSVPGCTPVSPERAEAVQSNSGKMLAAVPAGNEQIEEANLASLY